MVEIELFATNLMNPSHMEWTPDGRLLVSEHTNGTIKDATNGGDLANEPPVATGLDGPASIAPLKDGRILVAEAWGGRIKDISKGGPDYAHAPAFASGLSMPYSIVERNLDGKDRLFVSESFGPHHAQITEFTAGGDVRSAFGEFITNLPSVAGEPGLTPLHSWPHDWENFAAAGCVKDWEDTGDGGAKHYVAVGPLGQIFDVSSGGGDYFDLLKANQLIARGLHQLGGLKMNSHDGLIYAVEPKAGTVVAIDPAKQHNYKFEPPVVRGLNMPTCPRFSADGQILYVCDSGVGGIWKITGFSKNP